MTYIDFQKLRRDRSEYTFAFAPIDVRDPMMLSAEWVRDNTRLDDVAMAAIGQGISRVEAERPSPRLRRLLAILDWLPVDPATDEVWYLDEPVELIASDNHLVAAFVAQICADNMNLVFAPDDGFFTGAAADPFPGTEATRAAVVAYQRLMVERVYVASSIISPRVPPTVLASRAAMAIERANGGRRRLGLIEIAIPSRSTVSRWMPELQSRHAVRPGTGREWRSYDSHGRIRDARVTKA